MDDGKIVGGRFCVKLSGLPGNREEFKALPKPEGRRRFWSSQVQEAIENCAVLRQLKVLEQIVVPNSVEPVAELVK